MTVIYAGIALFVGTLLGAFLLVQAIIIVVFGIPFTFEMKRRGVLNSMAPAWLQVVSLVFLLGLFIFASWAIWHWFPRYTLPYGVGVGLMLLLAIGKCGRSPDNIGDFIRAHVRYMDQDVMQRYIDQHQAALRIHGLAKSQDMQGPDSSGHNSSTVE